MIRLALMGAPASGKGTQASRLVKEYHIPHISTGDILRKEIADDTEIGREVKDILSAGQLASDELMIEIIQHRLALPDCEDGFILDGFPRTIVQADKLAKMVELDCVVYISTPDDLILSRITARQTCSKCAATFNKLFLPPKVEGVCDKCGGALTQRKDDTKEAGLARLKTFHKQIDPLLDYYKERDMLFEIDGTMEVAELKASIMELLKKLS
ncbi:MAG: adenylate kinase [Bacillota bacterium]